MPRLMPAIFLAGFMVTAMIVSGGVTLLNFFQVDTVSALAGPMAEVTEVVVSICGGALAALTIGRHTSSHKS